MDWCVFVGRSKETGAQAFAEQTPILQITHVASGHWLGVCRTADAFDLDDASERDYLFLRLGETSEVQGLFFANAFEANFHLQVGIEMTRGVVSDYLRWISDNPFGALQKTARREEAGDRVRIFVDARLHSAEMRDACHELSSFAWRSGPQVEAQVVADIYDECAKPMRLGLLSDPGGALSAARIVFCDPDKGLRHAIGGEPLGLTSEPLLGHSDANGE